MGLSASLCGAPAGKKLLVVLSSPMGENSASTTVAKSFAEAYKKAFPTDTVEFLDLSKGLPPFTAARVQAKFALYGGADKAEGIKEWETSKSLIQQFTMADKIVVAAPMWNFFMPDTLKQYIDHIVQPNKTFDPATFAGLVKGKPAVIIRSAGGPVATAMDTGLAYLYKALGFIGFTDVRHIAVGGTADPSGRAALLEKASKEAAEIAGSLEFNPTSKPATLPALVQDARPTVTSSSSAPHGKKVLLITASPMGASSASASAAKAFLEDYKKSVHGTTVTTLDLAELVEAGTLPPYSALRVQGKFGKYGSVSAPLASDVAEEWAYCEARIKELVEADTVIFAVPMWNFAIPYSLSLYFHHVLQPNYTFNPATYAGLLPKGKHAFVVASAGGPSLGGDMDFLTPYVKQALSFIGVEHVHIAHINGTAGAGKEDAVKAAVASLKAQAKF